MAYNADSTKTVEGFYGPPAFHAWANRFVTAVETEVKAAEAEVKVVEAKVVEEVKAVEAEVAKVVPGA